MNQFKDQIKAAVAQIKIHPRTTKAGQAQRAAFAKRWGVKVESL